MMETLMQMLQRLHLAWIPLARHPFAPRYGAEVCGSAMETRTSSHHYSWDSMKRRSDPAHPFVIFQYTLAGWGYYTEGRTLRKVSPQMAFMAVVPSDNRYYLPPESSGWTFFWIIIRHPYVVNRIVQRRMSVGPILTLHPESMLVTRAVQLLEGIYSETFHDTFAEEQALFDFLIEYERVAYHSRYPLEKRECLLDNVRTSVLQALDQPIEVEQLAHHYEMSRSHFSHYFKNTTGIAPAQFVVQVRLEEATRRLLHTNLNLETIASETGFANANHFCKVFRRHYHLSPGEFRRQMSSDPEPISPAMFAEQAVE
ncbi:MAG TPA: helix-turn-helix transcriptional regulator [Ktedonobacteraceae bacterium]|nr:helix-turn-helix transcriptional regulator [Ktedonobacteraceae bacterium]